MCFSRNENGVPMQITVLCKVVDNFGDIGVAWRLCRRLAKIQSKYKICLVVDDLEAFAKIENSSNFKAQIEYINGKVIQGGTVARLN